MDQSIQTTISRQLPGHVEDQVGITDGHAGGQGIICQGVLDASAVVSHHSKGSHLRPGTAGTGDGNKLGDLAKRGDGIDTLADVLQSTKKQLA